MVKIQKSAKADHLVVKVLQNALAGMEILTIRLILLLSVTLVGCLYLLKDTIPPLPAFGMLVLAALAMVIVAAKVEMTLHNNTILQERERYFKQTVRDLVDERFNELRGLGSL